jgi:hypothetical protein
MSPKNIQLTFVVLNLFFAALNAALLFVGPNLFTLFVIAINLFGAKVCWDGYKRSTY